MPNSCMRLAGVVFIDRRTLVNTKFSDVLNNAVILDEWQTQSTAAKPLSLNNLLFRIIRILLFRLPIV